MKSSSSLVNIIKGNGKTILFPIVYAIEYYDTNALAKLMVTSKTVQFAIRDIPYLFPPSSNTYEKGNNVNILTVGDGNLSFSYSLAYYFNTYLPEINLRLTATTFDTYNDLIKKYPETKQIILKLLKFQCIVKHGIDAINLNEKVLLPPSMMLINNNNNNNNETESSLISNNNRYSYIFFMHPHLGIEDCKLHRLFLAHFFASCINICFYNDNNNNYSSSSSSSSSEILLSLIIGQAERWELFKQAKRLGLICIERNILNLHNFKGYETKRTNTGKSFKNVPTQKHVYTSQESFIYRLVRKQQKNVKKKKMRLKIVTNNNNKGKIKRKKSKTKSLVGNDEQLSCKICNKTFSTPQGLRTHTHTVHVLKLFDHSKIFTCTICQREFNSKDAYKQHCIAKHSGNDDDGDGINHHLQMMKNIENDNKSLKECVERTKTLCTICNELYDGTYEDHLKVFRPSTFLHKYDCNYCKKKSFRNERALEQHEKFCRDKSCLFK